MHSPSADLLLDGTINFPKTYSLAALIDPIIAEAFEDLQDRLRDRIFLLWRRELNARRGAGGRVRERIARLEVVELRHRRSRSLDPHVHRHLWLSMKVQGEDGKWSNLDSRVAMKLHTVVNAEGELAARTDPRWVAALAVRGYTLNVNGEIAELTTAVRPFSRRSNQIEANRVGLITAWEGEHPGLHPGPEELHHIDERAWAMGRANKPTSIDEATWEEKVLGELAVIDPGLLRVRGPVELSPVPLAQLDRHLLAAAAVIDADRRSVSSSGRFSLWDIRAGAIRVLASTGIIANRDLLDELVDDVCARAARHIVDLIPDDPNKPAHIKALMAEATVILKLRVASLYADLSRQGLVPTPEIIDELARAVIPDKHLNPDQLKAAAALAGTDRLVCVTGPAGAGKTAILQVALSALTAQRRRMLVVAPTRKAAAVVEHETDAEATSLHALLHDHGYRWHGDPSGAQHWSRLTVGDIDPATQAAYRGPTRFSLRTDDRVVVDEAGMVDLHTAAALAELAHESGFTIAMVGDPRQSAPVGHSGAMALAAQTADRGVELATTHRFASPAYADLTLRLRNATTPEEALAVASDLDAAGHVQCVQTLEDANHLMVDAWFRSTADGRRIALVTSSNDEAHAINEAIQQRRIDVGQISARHVAIGQDEQRLLEGDVIQTRRNDAAAGVQNRATWVIRRIRRGVIEIRSLTDSTDRRHIPADYVRDHIHLAYASTVHGIQGETTDASLVGPGVDAAGLYVGLTRGRANNLALCVAASREDGIAQIAESITRSQTETTVDESRQAAEIDLARAARNDPVFESWPGVATVAVDGLRL